MLVSTIAQQHFVFFVFLSKCFHSGTHSNQFDIHLGDFVGVFPKNKRVVRKQEVQKVLFFVWNDTSNKSKAELDFIFME